MGGHGRGKKRRRYQLVGGHRFMAGRHGRGDDARGTLSLCGLAMEDAARTSGDECQVCVQTASQLWA